MIKSKISTRILQLYYRGFFLFIIVITFRICFCNGFPVLFSIHNAIDINLVGESGNKNKINN